MNNKTSYLHLLIAITIGFILRLYGLADESLWLDEARTAYKISLGYKEIFSGVDSENLMPLYYLSLKVWSDYFGLSEFSIRFPSLIFGTLSILALYYLILEVFDRKVATISTYILAIHPYAIYYSQEARPYALFLLLSIVSYYFYLKVINLGRIRDCLFYVLSTLLAFHTHVFSIFFVFSQFLLTVLYYAQQKRTNFSVKIAPLLACLCTMIACCVPISAKIIEMLKLKLKGDPLVSWIPASTFESLIYIPSDFFIERSYGILFFYLFCFLVGKKINSYAANIKGLIFVSVVLVSFWFLPWIISVTITPLFFLRYTIPVLIAMVSLSAFAIADSRPRFLNAIFVFSMLLPLNNFYKSYSKDLWRQTGDYINKNFQEGDLIVSDPLYLDVPIKYYVDKKIADKVYGSYYLEDLKKALVDAKRVWIIDSYSFSENSDVANTLKPYGTKKRLGEVGEIYDVKISPMAISWTRIYISLMEKNVQSQ